MEKNNQEISVRKESTPLKSGEAIKYEIKNGLTIRELQNPEPLKQALRKIFVLVGIRAEQIPNEEEKTILITFIRERFGNFTSNELVLAFENALIDNFKADTEHFGQFTVKYLSKILNAYTEHRNKLAKELQIDEDKALKLKLEEEAEAKIQTFKDQALVVYAQSLKENVWKGTIFQANSIYKEVMKGISNEDRSSIWYEAQIKKNKQDIEHSKDPDKFDFSNIGLTAQRIFRELIVIEGIKRQIEL